VHYKPQSGQFLVTRDVNRGSKNRNSLQIRVLEIEFFQTRNSISLFVFLRKPLHKQLETGHLVSAQMARRGIAAQHALSTMTLPQRQGVNLKH